jgi:raffinose/stachyose/melibiose transport system permease protein
LLTGLNNISEEIYEAAEIDGATGFQRVRFITLPLLRSVIVTCLMLSVTGSLKVFDLPWTMLPNGAQNTFFTGTYMYFVTFQKQNIDYGSTIAIVIVVLGVTAAALCNLIFKVKED